MKIEDIQFMQYSISKKEMTVYLNKNITYNGKTDNMFKFKCEYNVYSEKLYALLQHKEKLCTI